MKAGKKSTALIAFVTGATILAASALADTIIGSGYHGLKDGAKTTMSKLCNEVESFTVNAEMTASVDGRVFEQEGNLTKYNMLNNSSVTSNTSANSRGSSDYYSYNDSTQSIYYDKTTDTYNVYTKTLPVDPKYRRVIDNPFEEEQMADVEKIVDAFVGTLQDAIQVEETDGKKMYIGNLSDAQIPSVVNAVVSYMMKYEILADRDWVKERYGDISYPKSNIFVKSASGRALQNEDGIFESIIGSLSISADDKNGVNHEYAFDISIKVTDINSTIVEAPDLGGKNVTFSRERRMNIDERYIGKYTSNIVTEEKGNGAFINTGSMVLEITAVGDDTVTGRMAELDADGNEVYSFDINAKANEKFFIPAFDYVDKEGNAKIGAFNHTDRGYIYMAQNITFNDSGGYSSNGSDIIFMRNF